MRKRTFPLFIIDSSRAHGRAWETDYVSCTSAELPFVAEVTSINDEQYNKEYDKDNDKIMYGDSHNALRYKIEVVEIKEGYDKTQLRGLLTRALKEYDTRRRIAVIRDEPDSNAVLVFVEELIKQASFALRQDPDNRIMRNSMSILAKIKKDYEEEFKK